jgi:type II secretory pathway component HofQ
MKIKVIFLLLPFVFVSVVFAKSKVYRNKDLERYQSRALQSSLNVKSSKISIDFVDANLYQVLQMIAEVAKGKDGVTIFIAPELSGKVTIKSTNVPWAEILKGIIREHNLRVLSLGKKTILIYGRG